MMEHEEVKRKRKVGLFLPLKRAMGRKDKKLDEQTGERRHLHTITLSPPGYNLSPDILLGDFIEKEAKFLGSLSEVSASLDPSSRTEILRILDKARHHRKLPSWPGPEHAAVISLSAHNLRLAARATDVLLARIFIHDISAVSYVRDDSLHLVILKTGWGGSELMEQEILQSQLSRSSSQLGTGCRPERYCNLVVLSVDSKPAAEELCSIISQIFQVVYTESTIDFLNRAILDGSSTPTKHSSVNSAYSSRDVKKDEDPESFATECKYESGAGDISPPSTKIQHKDGSGNGTFIPPDTQMLDEYMTTLRTKLSTQEIQEFATLLRDYRTGSSIQEFCQCLRQLYGESRKVLLLGMRDFIPEKDSQHFEAFLETVGVKNGCGIITDSFGRCKRTLSNTSTSTINGRGSVGAIGGMESPLILPDADDWDRKISDISHDLESLGFSVDLKAS
uniref:cerebral cavernous malformations 2 protein n=1 Tax=Myxine glutinosa TaxID=7769 RepID=UPI00358EC4C8